MPKGRKCSFCGKSKFDVDKGSPFDLCMNCGFVGWRLTAPVEPGPGKGYKCLLCAESTLHLLIKVKDVDMYRCSRCLYSGIRLTKGEVG